MPAVNCQLWGEQGNYSKDYTKIYPKLKKCSNWQILFYVVSDNFVSYYKVYINTKGSVVETYQ